MSVFPVGLQGCWKFQAGAALVRSPFDPQQARPRMVRMNSVTERLFAHWRTHMLLASWNDAHWVNLLYNSTDSQTRWKAGPGPKCSDVKYSSWLISFSSSPSSLFLYTSFTVATSEPWTHTSADETLHRSKHSWKALFTDAHSPGLCMWSIWRGGRRRSPTVKTSPAWPSCSGSPSFLQGRASPGLKNTRRTQVSPNLFKNHKLNPELGLPLSEMAM